MGIRERPFHEPAELHSRGLREQEFLRPWFPGWGAEHKWYVQGPRPRRKSRGGEDGEVLGPGQRCVAGATRFPDRGAEVRVLSGWIFRAQFACRRFSKHSRPSRRPTDQRNCETCSGDFVAAE